MGGEPGTAAIQDEVIAVDPNYQSDVARDDGEKPLGSSSSAPTVKREGETDADADADTDTEKKKKTKDAADDDDEKKEKEDVGMGNYGVSIPFQVMVCRAAAEPSLLHSAS